MLQLSIMVVMMDWVCCSDELFEYRLEINHGDEVTNRYIGPVLGGTRSSAIGRV
jgi:hypothetical protein